MKTEGESNGMRAADGGSGGEKSEGWVGRKRRRRVESELIGPRGSAGCR